MAVTYLGRKLDMPPASIAAKYSDAAMVDGVTEPHFFKLHPEFAAIYFRVRTDQATKFTPAATVGDKVSSFAILSPKLETVARTALVAASQATKNMAIGGTTSMVDASWFEQLSTAGSALQASGALQAVGGLYQQYQKSAKGKKIVGTDANGNPVYSRSRRSAVPKVVRRWLSKTISKQKIVNRVMTRWAKKHAKSTKSMRR